MDSRGHAPSTACPGGTAAVAGPGGAVLTTAPGPGTPERDVRATSRPRALARTRRRPSQQIPPAELRRRARILLDDGFRLCLVAARGGGPGTVPSHVVYLFAAPRPDRRVELVVPVRPEDRTVPSLALTSFAAGRLERELYTTHGILAVSGTPLDAVPALRPAAPAAPEFLSAPKPGWEQRAAGRSVRSLLPRLERHVPDSGVAHAVAFCLAVEDAYDVEVPGPVAAARAALMELERVRAHLGGIAAMCSGAGLDGTAAEVAALRRRVLRLSAGASGHRLLRGAVVPGGVRLRQLPEERDVLELEAAADVLTAAVRSDLVVNTTYRGRWVVTNRHVMQTGVLGFIARASGHDVDARRNHAFHPATAHVASITATAGDALARLDVRCREVGAGLSLLADLLPHTRGLLAWPASLPEGLRRPLRGIGLAEGPHGTIAHRVEIGPDGGVTNLRVVDPAFLSCSVLTVAQLGPHDEHGSTVDPGFGLPATSAPWSGARSGA